jgi:cytochrome P450
VSFDRGFPGDVVSEDLDHLSPELAATFHETMTELRATCPVAHSSMYGGFWIVTTYDDVLRVAQDWETFSSAYGLTVPVAPIVVRSVPVEVDPPIQRVYKRLINQYLTPAAVAPWEAGTRALANHLIDQFIEDGACDFMAAFARPFPAQAFFEFGINAPREEIQDVAYMAARASTPTDPEAAKCWAGLAAWVNDFLEKRRNDPRDDLVDGLLHAQVEGRPITHDEVMGCLQLLILGGLDTTAGALAQMMVRFCGDPPLRIRLTEHPELLEAAIEELLRLDGPFISIARTATRDTELGGRSIKEGEKVILYWASANRDEREFPHADQFDLERGSNRHLAFGAGPHRCAGSNVARLNLRVALSELLPRLHDVALRDGADIRYHSTFTRWPYDVPITYTPGPRMGS